MIKFNNTSVMNIENAIRGMRNPLNSWSKSDSGWGTIGDFEIGMNDLDLARRLRNAGSDHRKFMRQIFVSVDIVAPLYWWKEYETYKVGTTANSCSTMHKIQAKEFTLEDFSCERLTSISSTYLNMTIGHLEALRLDFLETKDKKYWYSMIQLLPSSYNQVRTCTMTYENLINMYHARKNHKLDEWKEFSKWIETLPYAKELIIGD